VSKLFTPISIGNLRLSHRVVMAPLTRSRADLPAHGDRSCLSSRKDLRRDFATAAAAIMTACTFGVLLLSLGGRSNRSLLF